MNLTGWESIKISLNNIIRLAITNNIASAISLSVDIGDENKFIIDDETIYDLASLTKILCTCPLIAKAIAENKIALNEEPFPFWPKVTIAHLLAHTSGLPAHVHFYENPNVVDKSTFFAELFKQNLINSPGEVRIYSDLGFLALGYLLEQRYKKSLKDLFRAYNRHCERSVAIQTNLHNDEIASPKARNDENAEVHDKNARCLGELAGHAGLFGNLSDVALMGRYFLRCYKNPKNYEETILQYFMKNHLGFDKPRKGGSTQSLSPYAFGHFGYTGVSLWIDPKAFHNSGVIVTLLTDRVKISEDPKGIFWLRKKVHDAVRSLV